MSVSIEIKISSPLCVLERNKDVDHEAPFRDWIPEYSFQILSGSNMTAVEGLVAM